MRGSARQVTAQPDRQTKRTGGVPLILASFGLVIWRFGFGKEDRLLFKMRKKDIAVDLPAPGTSGSAPR